MYPQIKRDLSKYFLNNSWYKYKSSSNSIIELPLPFDQKLEFLYNEYLFGTTIISKKPSNPVGPIIIHQRELLIASAILLDTSIMIVSLFGIVLEAIILATPDLRIFLAASFTSNACVHTTKILPHLCLLRN